MKTLFLLTTIVFSTSAHLKELSKIWELELQIDGETSNLVIELTAESSDSCLIANPKKVKILKDYTSHGKYFKGYSYSINGGVLSIDMFPLLCDGGNLIRGKIDDGTISGKILSSSFAGLKNIGLFKGKSTNSAIMD